MKIVRRDSRAPLGACRREPARGASPVPDEAAVAGRANIPSERSGFRPFGLATEPRRARFHDRRPALYREPTPPARGFVELPVVDSRAIPKKTRQWSTASSMRSRVPGPARRSDVTEADRVLRTVLFHL